MLKLFKFQLKEIRAKYWRTRPLPKVEEKKEEEKPKKKPEPAPPKEMKIPEAVQTQLDKIESRQVVYLIYAI